VASPANLAFPGYVRSAVGSLGVTCLFRCLIGRHWYHGSHKAAVTERCPASLVICTSHMYLCICSIYWSWVLPLVALHHEWTHGLRSRAGRTPRRCYPARRNSKPVAKDLYFLNIFPAHKNPSNHAIMFPHPKENNMRHPLDRQPRLKKPWPSSRGQVLQASPSGESPSAVS
jgi:hypothetical protein